MNKTLGSIVGIISIGALLLSISAYNKTPEMVVGSQGQKGIQGIQGERGEMGPAGRDGKNGVTQIITKTAPPVLGSVSGPELSSPYFCINGGNAANAGSYCEYVQSGTFADATNTLAVITNPFNATSTIKYANITGVNSTSTIDILMGTSSLTTAQSVSFNNQISPTILNVATIATSTNFFAVNGVTVYGTGANSAGTGSLTRIEIGPSERIFILATSTYSASSAAGNGPAINVGNLFSGTYKIVWEK